MSKHRADAPRRAEPETGPERKTEPEPGEPRARSEAAEPAGGRWWLRGRVLLVAGVLLTAAAVVAAVLVLRRDTPATGGEPDTAGAASSFVRSATADITAVTAYDYRSLDVALQAGSAVSTGRYRTAFRAAINGELGARARQLRIVQSFEQNAAGIGTISEDLDTAKVLVFGVQSISRNGADPVQTPVTLTATIVHANGKYLISDLSAGANAGVPSGNPNLAQAAETARRHTVASLTLRRGSLSSDYAAALSDTVDPRRAALVRTLATPKEAVARGDYDLSGRVTAIAIEAAPSTGAVVVLVAATGLRLPDGDTARATVVSDDRLRVTVVEVDGVWRVSDSQPVAG